MFVEIKTFYKLSYQPTNFIIRVVVRIMKLVICFQFGSKYSFDILLRLILISFFLHNF